jgi:hypothetical protein
VSTEIHEAARQALNPSPAEENSLGGCVHRVCTLIKAKNQIGDNQLEVFDIIGERGGTRTLDPMIKSHVLYRLSYALTRRAV